MVLGEHWSGLFEFLRSIFGFSFLGHTDEGLLPGSVKFAVGLCFAPRILRWSWLHSQKGSRADILSVLFANFSPGTAFIASCTASQSCRDPSSRTPISVKARTAFVLVLGFEKVTKLSL